MITITLPYPISANRYWAHRVIPAKGAKPAMALTYVTPAAKEYRAKVARIARAAGVAQLAGRYVLEIDLYPQRPLDWAKRVRKLGAEWDDSVQCIDLGNAEKVLSDALQGTLFADDCKARRIVLERMVPDEHGARLVVRVAPRPAKAAQSLLLEVA